MGGEPSVSTGNARYVIKIGTHGAATGGPGSYVQCVYMYNLLLTFIAKCANSPTFPNRLLRFEVLERV